MQTRCARQSCCTQGSSIESLPGEGGQRFTFNSSHVTSTGPTVSADSSIINVAGSALPDDRPSDVWRQILSAHSPMSKNKNQSEFCCPRSQLLQCSFHGCERQLSQSKLNLWGALANSPSPSFSPTSSPYRHPIFFYPGWQKQVIAGATDPPPHPPTPLTNTRPCSVPTIVTLMKMNFRCIGTFPLFRF